MELEAGGKTTHSLQNIFLCYAHFWLHRWLFIVEGAATTGWALISMFILLDFPANTKRLTERERKIAIARLRESNVTTRTEDNASVGKRQSFMLALRDWRTWGFIFGYMV